MAIEVEQIINTPDTDYPDIYGHVTAVVHDTETGERSTASYEYVSIRGSTCVDKV